MKVDVEVLRGKFICLLEAYSDDDDELMAIRAHFDRACLLTLAEELDGEEKEDIRPLWKEEKFRLRGLKAAETRKKNQDKRVEDASRGSAGVGEAVSS